MCSELAGSRGMEVQTQLPAVTSYGRVVNRETLTRSTLQKEVEDTEITCGGEDPTPSVSSATEKNRHMSTTHCVTDFCSYLLQGSFRKHAATAAQEAKPGEKI